MNGRQSVFLLVAVVALSLGNDRFRLAAAVGVSDFPTFTWSPVKLALLAAPDAALVGLVAAQ